MPLPILRLANSLLLLAAAAPSLCAQPALNRDAATRINWTLRVHLSASGDLYLQPDDDGSPRPKLSEVGIVFPMITSSASHVVTEADRVSHLEFGPRVIVDRSPTLLSVPSSEAPMGKLQTKSLDDTPAVFLQIPMTCYETIIDEPRAREIGWPIDGFPADVRWALEPQAFIESDDAQVRALVQNWTNGNPQRARPYDLAKHLAAQTMLKIERIDDPRISRPNTLASTASRSAFPVNGAAHAAHARRLSSYDASCLLTALYRAAGIPARMVIAIDTKAFPPLETRWPSPRSGQRFTLQYALGSDAVGLQSATRQAFDEQCFEITNPMPIDRYPYSTWVEFYLYDESTGIGEWIPVDIAAQKRESTRPPRLNQSWAFFGNHEHLDDRLPFSFHIIPPTSHAMTGRPSFMAWEPPYVAGTDQQTIIFDVLHTIHRDPARP